MNSTIHILNGDSTLFGLKKGGIKGDVLVWREMLVEGDLEYDVGTDEFWKKRYQFFKESLNVDRLEYFDKVIKELVQIEDLSTYKEVVLWFEYDLFCQVNLMALCSYLLKNYRKDITYYLVCVGKKSGVDTLQTLADYAPDAYKLLYEDRIKITRNDLLFADASWKVYVDNKTEELTAFNFDKNKKFRYLQMAIKQHLKRTPDKIGLNQLDYIILKTIQAKQATEKQILNALLHWQRRETVYGFGDLQYLMHLKNLKKFYSIEKGKYALNTLGKSILTQQ